MTVRREPVIVILVAVLSLTPVMLGVALFPPPAPLISLAAPWCLGDSKPYSGSVALTPQSPVLLPRYDRYNISAGAAVVGFQLDAPADFSGAWAASSPTNVVLGNLSWGACADTLPLPPQLNGTFNTTLFPGNYVIVFDWYSGPDIVLTATQAWTATFDRGLDVLQSPEQVTLPPNGHAAWTVSAPGNASRFFLENAMETTSCDFELAVLPPAVYRAYASGQGPLNGTGTDVLYQVDMTSPGSPNPCGPSSGTTFFFGVIGPFNWTASDVAVFCNEAVYAAPLYVYAPLEASYLTG